MTDLPLGIKKSDTDYPHRPKNIPSTSEAWYRDNKVVHHIELYEVKNIGWVVATLRISNGTRNNPTARTYAVDLNGKVYTVGKGPHVLRTVTVRVTAARLTALQKLVDLHTSGSEQANIIRDRISSRRAQGALHRAAGKSRWNW